MNENSAADVSASLATGWIPRGSRMDGKWLVVPDGAFGSSVRPRGSSAIVAHFPFVRSQDGTVIKSRVG